jgi:hypothetical protein
MFTNVVRKETNAILGGFTVFVITNDGNVADMGAVNVHYGHIITYMYHLIITRDLE